MKPVVVSSAEWTYPDTFTYPSASDKAVLAAARNSIVSFQALLPGMEKGAAVRVKATGELSGLAFEAYELVAVYNDYPTLTPEQYGRGCPSRVAPFYVYDCIRPLTDQIHPHDGCAGFYFAFRVDQDAKPGRRSGEIELTVGDKKYTIPVCMTVCSAVVPKETLSVANSYHRPNVATYHHVGEDSPEFEALDRKYTLMLRRARQTSGYSGGVKTTVNEDGSLSFDFSDMEREVKKSLELGFTLFRIGFGGRRKSWQEPTILVGDGLPSMSYEGYVYLSQYLPALDKFLVDKGWAHMFLMSVSDEPNDFNATEYRALAGLARKLAPHIRLYNALSYTNVHGALDVWIPLNSEYDKHRKEFESFRGKGDELWHYTCCGPRSEGYINRFLDYPLLATRYLHWGNYAYNLTGFLHWGGNSFQPGQDPFTVPGAWHTNTDSNGRLPAGDTHIIYPGEGEPWMSIRLEMHRASAEEYELFRVLEKADKDKADAICAKGFRSFNDVTYDVKAFEAARLELLEAVSALG